MNAVPWRGLDAFLAIVEAGSIRAAANSLGVKPPAVSQLLAKLEADIGTPLFQRTTREINITPAGETLLAAVRPGYATIKEGLDAVRGHAAEPEGVIRLTAPYFIADSFLMPALDAFRQAYPGITVDLHASDRMDSLVTDGFDGGVRSVDLVHQDYVAVRLTPPLTEAVCAAPNYLAARGTPGQPEELLEHACIRYRFDDARLSSWRFVRDGEDFVVDVPQTLVVNDTRLLIDAVRRGMGIGYLVRAAAREAISAGEIITVFDDLMPSLSGFYLYFPKRAAMPRRFRVFIDFIKAWDHRD